MSDKLDADVADRLLERLINDDAFRTRFSESPADALREVGHDMDANGEVASCLCVKSLASPEVLRRSRDELHALMTAGLGQEPHKLEG